MVRESLLFSVISVLLAAGAQPVRAATPDVAPGLESLRSGQFEQAEAIFSAIAREAPSSPEGPFFLAFRDWWVLLDTPDDESVRLRMEKRLSEAIRLADRLARSRDGSERSRGLVYGGVGRLLDAQSKSRRGSHFKAASSARKGHKTLSRALKEQPDLPAALFAMGAYNYYADNLPALVKGLRFILFIPGGDKSLGLVQLEKASVADSVFGTESLILLSHIYSGGFEEDYRRALSYIEEASQRHPDSPLVGLAEADLLFELGRFQESAARARRALAKTRDDPSYPGRMRRFASYRIALCEMYRHDPLAALRQMVEGLHNGDPLSVREQKKWSDLIINIAAQTGQREAAASLVGRLGLPHPEAESLEETVVGTALDPVWPERSRALASLATGHDEAALRGIRDLLLKSPSDARLHYDMGRLLQMEGRMAEARPHLEYTVDVGSSPDLLGWALIRLGWEKEQSGNREEAVGFYRKAAGIEKFGFTAAARDLVAHPSLGQPDG